MLIHFVANMAQGVESFPRPRGGREPSSESPATHDYDESRRLLPYLCITFASSKQIYISTGRIATTSYNKGIVKEAVGFLSTLIDSEEEDFMENYASSAALMNLLIRITGVNSIRLGLDAEINVVELAFNITMKIILDPATPTLAE